MQLEERNRLVEACIPKVRKTAASCWHKTQRLFDLEDLEQIAIIGLLEDLPKWDPAKCPLDFFVLMVARRRIFNYMRLDVHGIIDRSTLKVRRRVYSLDEPITPGSAVTSASSLSSAEPDPFEVVDGIRTREQLNTAIASLTPMQQAVIAALYVHEDDRARAKVPSGYFHHRMGVRALRCAITGNPEPQPVSTANSIPRCNVPSAHTAEIVASVRKGVALTHAQRTELQRLACWKPCSTERRAQIRADRQRRLNGSVERRRVVTDSQINELRTRVAAGERCSVVARALGVKYTTAHAIVSGRSWANLPEAA